MIGAILVAVGADAARKRGRIFMAGMASGTGLMLRLGVQARKLLNLMAGRAGGHASRPGRTVGTMAGQTTRAELSVSALLLGSVAVGASLPRWQTLVRFMTIGADLVPLRRSLLFDAMAVGARRRLRSGMRFVAANAFGVTGFD